MNGEEQIEKQNYIEKIKAFFQDKQKVKYLLIGLGGLFLAVILFIVASNFIKNKDYAVLYSNLSPDDAGNVLTVLSQENIPYKLEGNGTIILVPKDKVYDTRLKLAAKGLPSGKVVGFEIFEEPKMGTTQFQENVNYIRAIEGELVRTIKQIDAVMDAKVNIAMPKDSIFVREEDQPKASVIIKLYPDKDLTKEQVKAIVFLVSHAVPKLTPENVTVVDNRGRVLSDLIDENKDIESGNSIADIKRKLEKQIEKDIQSMLAKAVGPERVVVKASVELETGKMAQKDEIYDPDKVAVVSERKIKESETENPQTINAPPGTPTNVPPVMNVPVFSGGTKQKEKSDITTNYDVSKSVIESKKPIFNIKKISVGVMIDGRYKEVKDQNGNITLQFEPRTQQELQSYENLIKSAIGFDQNRGDQVTVISVPFEAEKPAIVKEETSKTLWFLLAGVGLLFLVLIGLIIFLLRAKKKKEQPTTILAQQQLLEEQLETLRKEEKEIVSFETEPNYIKLIEVAKENPQLIANLISKWLKEEPKPATERGKK
ncbi:flagellar basal-body MS-ring/collar protein FliF [Venenivibrio stagnispumantis]|uniref:Flagellar M-ring protein n=1 Tax=Venenivibrio stagnispumantis TaxID=407998 RepID=A0AA45WIL9_9AQUI|nr:flagellar basal-body MS-ring/collar protein FliF [Venenivibrio stagnispumantis]MCW4572628.1 flagellar basal-body MS-ring/collar protein FliF [Venenivibrio stagnispumantis]SMP00670.1 flagellar M-ring protein FliF [Venenivibrio stagnispumantis]